jgi:hypothetical protein
MAKPLGAKSWVIRAAIAANPDKENKQLAEALNDSQDRLDDKLTFTAQDVAGQRQAMKKPGALKVDGTASSAAAPGKPAKKKKKRGRKPGRRPSAAPGAAPSPAKAARTGPVEVIDRLFGLADDVGGMGALKKLVDRIATTARG